MRINTPAWTPTATGPLRPDHEIHFTDTTAGPEILWHARYDNFADTGPRKAWYAWPDVPDPDQWDRPVWLARRIQDAQDEFLIRIVHGWRGGYGYVGYDSQRPIYGRGSERRERVFILGELTDRGVCPRCRTLVKLTSTGTIRLHGATGSECRKAQRTPADEPELGIR